MTTFQDLEGARYVSLGTFRKSGAMVATPVWAAADGESFYVFSAGDAGKVKRLRNSARAQLAVCTVNGKLLSGWVDAEAHLIDESAEIARALAALRRKYGFAMWLADAGAKLSGRFQRRAYIRVKLVDAPLG